METIIKKMIFNNEFEETYELLKSVDDDEKFNYIVSISCDTTDIRIIGFVSFLIQKDNSYNNYRIMVNVLHQMCWLNGAYHLAYFYANEMYKRSGSIGDKKNLLFYWLVPEKPMSDDHALTLSREILKEDPYYNIAKEIIEKLEN